MNFFRLAFIAILLFTFSSAVLAKDIKVEAEPSAADVEWEKRVKEVMIEDVDTIISKIKLDIKYLANRSNESIPQSYFSYGLERGNAYYAFYIWPTFNDALYIKVTFKNDKDKYLILHASREKQGYSCSGFLTSKLITGGNGVVIGDTDLMFRKCYLRFLELKRSWDKNSAVLDTRNKWTDEIKQFIENDL